MESTATTSSTTVTVTGATPTLLALDGNSLCHRAFHAYGPRNGKEAMTNAAGKEVFALYGFFALLAGICDKVRPDAVVVGFDDHTESVRKARCPEYKATRSDKDPSLYAQMADIITLLGELGIPVIIPAGLEADDVVASAAATAEAAGWRCVVATSDRDSFALINDNTTVLRLVSGLDNAVWATPAWLAETYGVIVNPADAVAAYTQYAALRGDTSDNLPGALGIGEKTAAKLLAALGTVEAALADPAATAAAIGRSAAAKLVAGEANYRRNLDIMAMIRDLPVDLEAARLPLDAEVVAERLLAWELPNLVARVRTAFGSRAPASFPEPSFEPATEERAEGQATPARSGSEASQAGTEALIVDRQGAFAWPATL